MGNIKSTPKKEKKRHTFQFSFRSGFLLSIGFFFILGWVFFLGILVGRGLLPNSIESFFFSRKKIAHNETHKKNNLASPIKIDELTFYNQLIDKKEKAKKKASPVTLLKHQVKKPEKKKIEQVKEHIGSYSIQVAALKDKARTKKMVERLLRSGYQAYYYQILINGEIFYRIRFGPFSTLKTAKKNAKRLADREGLKPFIVYPDK